MQKTYRFEVKTYDPKTGEVEGYANTFNFKDFAGDITMPGAFAESLAEHKRKGTNIKMLWQHDHNNLIGVWYEGFEDDKGLYLKGKLTLGVQKADEALLLLASGALDSLSIGYAVIEEEYSYKEDANKLIKVRLDETSFVTFPANEQSRIESVKSKPTQRELEKQLRKAGLSQKNAKAFLAKGYKAIEDEAQEDLEPVDVMEIVTAIVEAIPEDVLMDVSAEEVQEIFEEAIDEIVDEEKRKARKARKDLAEDEYEETKEATDDEGDTVLDEIMEILDIVDSKNTPRKETLNTDEDNEMLSTPSEDEDFLKSLQSLMRSKAKTGRSNLKAKANAMSAKSKR
ncbi:HK97 family phage prohead protease [Aeromonas dhakensis]|uniref:HK97 family phage prohead protease n=1 Tax=Aeromonas dhakensis TaxID=196024 RepID=UPI0019815085|nr:HK97 family phage prohead protease [Aeromonas dhakensis]MBW3732473.1 HK97 family phage prohead protease [Aeromonas dhakensis]QSR57036.1 HK97 family phage prohead protease [Aeromonas dhakensis]